MSLNLGPRCRRSASPIASDPQFSQLSDRGANSPVLAFLYLKREDESENYTDISPPFPPGRRLKIGTFKVAQNGHRLGERFLKIIFDNALRGRDQAIYVTLYRSSHDHDRLASLLLDWGFVEHGTKESPNGPEFVMVRNFAPRADSSDPRITFPYVSRSTRKFIVPIWPKYHSDLLPDSVLRTENHETFDDSKSHRNALSKVYISRSFERSMKTGDIVIFYRTKSDGHAHYTSVATTIGVVQSVSTNIADAASFLASCRKRSVFSDEQLLEHWNYRPRNRPFVVNFLCVQSFPIKPNLERLKSLGILQEAPRGFEVLSDDAFDRLVSAARVDRYLIVD